MDEPWGHGAKWDKPHKRVNTVTIALIQGPKKGKFMEAQQNVVPEDWE